MTYDEMAKYLGKIAVEMSDNGLSSVLKQYHIARKALFTFPSRAAKVNMVEAAYDLKYQYQEYRR